MKKKIMLVIILLIIIISGVFIIKKKSFKNEYIVKVISVDEYSPARVLEVYENGKKIDVQAINYIDGVLLCSGEDLNVNKFVIEKEKKLEIVLQNGNKVIAKVQ